MALKRFTVPDQPKSDIYFGSMSWTASFDGTKIVFTNPNMTSHNKVVLNGVKAGDEVGFEANGPDSRAFKVKAPKDLKYAIMWKYGFTKPKRVTSDVDWEDGEDFPGFHTLFERHYTGDYWRNSYGQLTMDWDVRYVTIYDDKGRIMVQTGFGRLERSNNHFDHWFMHHDATLEHVKAWEKEYLNKEGGETA